MPSLRHVLHQCGGSAPESLVVHPHGGRPGFYPARNRLFSGSIFRRNSPMLRTLDDLRMPHHRANGRQPVWIGVESWPPQCSGKCLKGNGLLDLNKSQPLLAGIYVSTLAQSDIAQMGRLRPTVDCIVGRDLSNGRSVGCQHACSIPRSSPQAGSSSSIGFLSSSISTRVFSE
jgi:hypothetical protein